MLGVLRYRTFRLLWLSQTVSQVGDRLTLIVLAIAVTDLSGSASAVGVVLAARYAPLILLCMVGGVWADRLPRRSILLVSDTCRFALHTVLALLFVLGMVEVWHVIVIEALFAVAEAFSIPALQGLLPQALPDDDDLQAAMGLSQMSRNLAYLVGPAAGTAIYVTAGAGWAFALDAATFAVALLLLLGVRPRRRGEPVARTGLLHELRDGVREVAARRWLWVTVLTMNLWVLLADGPFAVLGPTLGEEVYGDASTFGVAISVFGAGLVAGAVVGARLSVRRPLLAGYGMLVPVALAYVAFGVGAPLWVTLVTCAVGGAGAACFDVLWYTAMAVEVPPEALSRVMAFDWMGSLASLPIAYLVAGHVADTVGAEAVLIVGGALALALIAVGLATRAVREFSPRDPAAASRSSGVQPDLPAPAAPR